MSITPSNVTEVSHSVKNLLENWMHIKLAIQRAFSKGPLTREQETAFLHLKSSLSRLHRLVVEQLPKGLQFEGDEMMAMMKNITTMESLKGMPLAEKRNIFSQWHKFYIMMSRTYGALEVMEQGYYPQVHRDLLKPKDQQGSGKKRGRGKKGKGAVKAKGKF